MLRDPAKTLTFPCKEGASQHKYQHGCVLTTSRPMFKQMPLVCFGGYPLLPNEPSQRCVSLRQKYITISHSCMGLLDPDGQFSLGIIQALAAKR